jgi:hypothetical protein
VCKFGAKSSSANSDRSNDTRRRRVTIRYERTKFDYKGFQTTTTNTLSDGDDDAQFRFVDDDDDALLKEDFDEN